MPKLPANIAISALGEYIAWDSHDEAYTLRRDGPRKASGPWWCYPHRPGKGIPCFYAGTLALISLRLSRRESTSCIPRLPHEPAA